MRSFFSKKNDYNQSAHFLSRDNSLDDVGYIEGYKKRWVEDVWHTDDDGVIIKPLKEFLGVSINRNFLTIALLVVFLVVFCIISRLFYLQIWRGSYYFQQAEENRLRIQPIIAERGIIFDSNMTQLTTNISSFNLVLVPRDLPKQSEQLTSVLNRIADISGEDVIDLRKKVEFWRNSKYQSIDLVENLDYQKALKLLVESADLPGVNLVQNYKRFYNFNPSGTTATTSINIATSVIDNQTTSTFKEIGTVSSLSHIIGYEGRLTQNDINNTTDYLSTDYIGKNGLEKTYENVLRGSYGQKEVEVDAFGKEKSVIKVTPPQPGKNLVLSINLQYQKKLEEILVANLNKLGKKKAAAIVLNPNNGEILAMVNWPSYNNNLFASGIPEKTYQKLLVDPDAPLFSRAWSGNYPAGSTVKQIVASAALTEGLITRSTSFLSTGGLQVDKWFFPDWKTGGHGVTNVTKALAESVNTFFYIVGGGYNNFTGLGVDKITLYFSKFGLGKKLGIDLPNESSGFVPSKEWKLKTRGENWYIGDTYNLAIGQGDLLISPLQIAEMTAIVANGGTFYKPHVVKATINPVDNNQEKIKSEIVSSNIIDDKYLSIVRDGMRQAVTDGSARALAGASIKIAGKTGTAQWSKKAGNHAWFTSFAPFDKPQLVVTVLIEEGVEGSSAAIPVAKEFYEWWATTPR